MDVGERDHLVQSWIKLQHAAENSSCEEKLAWASRRFWQATEQEPELAWVLILEVLKNDQSDKVLQNLAAGPLEDLLVAHGEIIIEYVEKEATHNHLFKTLLGGVWQNEIVDDVWRRLKRVAGEPW